MNRDEQYYRGLFEALFLIANEPLNLEFLEKISKLKKREIRAIVNQMIDEYLEKKGGIVLLEIAGGYQFATNPEYADLIRPLFSQAKKEKLSKSAMEVLAIIAYRQPIHVAAIDELRGSSSRQHIASLMKRGFVVPQKRLELPGRPMSYGTSSEFLKYFHLKSLKDLPKLSEIKDMQFESLFEDRADE